MTLEIYKLSSSFPASERFGLTNQLQRASISAASNIAEGYGRSTKGGYLVLLGHARGQDFKVQTQLAISAALGFGSEQSQKMVASPSDEVSRMLVAMMSMMRK
jgi:four helix bundle protein